MMVDHVSIDVNHLIGHLPGISRDTGHDRADDDRQKHVGGSVVALPLVSLNPTTFFSYIGNDLPEIEIRELHISENTI